VVPVLVDPAAVVRIVAQRENHRARVFLQDPARECRGRHGAGVAARRAAHVADGDDDLF
jgi:hypothetical protein